MNVDFKKVNEPLLRQIFKDHPMVNSVLFIPVITFFYMQLAGPYIAKRRLN
jgi:hypothetical protein